MEDEKDARAFKIKFYWKKGKNKGKQRTEVFYPSADRLYHSYRTLYMGKEDSLNPTAWMLSDGEWTRILDADILDLAIESEEITNDIAVTDNDIDDIVDAALEGGISYWCHSAELDGAKQGETLCEHVSRGGTLKLYVSDSDEPSDDSEAVCYKLDRNELLRGIRLWYKECPDSAKTATYRSEDVLRLDSSMIDAAVSDAIVQYALFGELVFS